MTRMLKFKVLPRATMFLKGFLLIKMLKLIHLSQFLHPAEEERGAQRSDSELESESPGFPGSQAGKDG